MTRQLTAIDVKRWREATDMTQTEFAAMLGMSRPYVARVEGGDTEPPLWMTLARAGWYAEHSRARDLGHRVATVFDDARPPPNFALQIFPQTQLGRLVLWAHQSDEPFVVVGESYRITEISGDLVGTTGAVAKVSRLD